MARDEMQPVATIPAGTSFVMLSRAELKNLLRRKDIYLAVLAALSVALYSVIVLSLHQERAHHFPVELAGPVPVAVSFLEFGTKFGFEDTGVRTHFRTRMETAEEVI